MIVGLQKLYAGDFNNMNQKHQPDGSIIITLSKRGEGKTYKFRVEDLYGKNEKVLEHEVIDVAEQQRQKPWIAERMKEAEEEEAKEKEEKAE